MNYKEILATAINNEVEAYEFYTSASLKSVNPSLKDIFKELADEEQKHKRLLEGFLKDNSLKMNFATGADYKISESVELPKLTKEMSFSDGIALAMKKEEEAMEMYQKFADATTDHDQKNTFLQLAKMEKTHKTRLEDMYTNAAYNEVW
ncbi:MAG: ferritin family protein [Bacteroidales bacterium]|jgi:rubrerythrin|nr:ferritin family protein [Bacteroidales bacterium]